MKPTALNLRKDAIGKCPRAIRKGILLDPHAIEDTQKEIRHPIFALLPVLAMSQSHGVPTSDQGREILRPMRGTRTATEQHNRIVEYSTFGVSILFHALEEVCQLFAQESIVFRKF